MAASARCPRANPTRLCGPVLTAPAQRWVTQVVLIAEEVFEARGRLRGVAFG